MNYHKKQFHVISTSENGEVEPGLLFNYIQKGNILSCAYSSIGILSGHLLGTVDADGKINMAYHQINSDGQIMTGKCISVPETLPDGKIRLHESWEWTSGNKGKGTSILEEV